MRLSKFIIAVAVCLLPCSMAKAQDNFRYEEKSVTVVEPEAHLTTIPLVADVSIIGDRFTETVVLEEFRACRRNLWYLSELKTFALAQLAEKYGADFIIATSVNVSTKQKHFAFTVTGYPAKYSNFRKPGKDDMDIIWKSARSGEEEDAEIMDNPRIIRPR